MKLASLYEVSSLELRRRNKFVDELILNEPILILVHLMDQSYIFVYDRELLFLNTNQKVKYRDSSTSSILYDIYCTS